MKYIPLDNVFNFLPGKLREDMQDDDQIRSWALQYLRTVESSEMITNDVALIEINNHTGSLPDYKAINMIRYFSTKPPESFVTECVSTLEESEKETPDPTPSWRVPTTSIYEQLFLATDNSGYSQRMRYVGNTGQNYFTKSCYKELISCPRCWIDFSLSTDGCNITLSENCGYVCIEYTRAVTSPEGDWMLPAEPMQLWQALGSYVQQQYWMNQLYMGQSSALQLSTHFQQVAANYMKEARGIIRMRGIDYHTLFTVIYSESFLHKIPAVFGFRGTRLDDRYHYYQRSSR